MRLAIPALLTVLLLSGCGADSLGGADSARVAIPPPDFSLTPGLSIRIGGAPLQLGDARTKFLPASAKPEDVVVSQELPAKLRGSEYTVESWQRSKRGAGAVYYGDKICLAMETLEADYEVDFKNLTLAYQADMEKVREAGSTITPFRQDSKYTSYRIWDASGQRLFLLQVRMPNGKFRLTTAVGYIQVMDLLGFSKDVAVADAGTVDTLFDKVTNGAASPSATPTPTPTPSGSFSPDSGIHS